MGSDNLIGTISTHGEANRRLEILGGDKDRQLHTLWKETNIGKILPWDDIEEEAEELIAKKREGKQAWSSDKTSQQRDDELIDDEKEPSEEVIFGQRRPDSLAIDWNNKMVYVLDDEVSAFETVWGRSPTLIVVDNLMDIAMDGHEEFQGMRAAMKELKYLARDTNAAVLVLHHTKEGFEGFPCQPRSAIQGLVNQIPAMVLTIGQMKQGDDTYLCVAPVKNRYGRADQTGSNYVSLAFNPDSMYLDDVPIRYAQEGMM